MIKELSSLRGIFILFIFLHHMSVFPGGGGMGVAFFFVLGGFAMTLGYHEKVMNPSFAYGSYLGRRMIKFYPLHWLCLLLSLPLTYQTFSWLTFVVNAALLHSWIPIGKFNSYNMVSWYLADTMFFAVVFPYLYRCINGIKTKWVGAFFLIVVYILIDTLIPNNLRREVLYIHPMVRLLDFIVGIGACMLYLNIKDNTRVNTFVLKNRSLIMRSIWLAILLLMSMAFSLSGKMHSVAAYYWPLIVFVVIATSLTSASDRTSILRNKWLILFGEYSFPFFMLHPILIMYVYKFIRPSLCLLTDNRYILQMMLIIVCFIITLIATILIQNYINKPVTQWLIRKIQPSMTARS